jgi:hypothetical protein
VSDLDPDSVAADDPAPEKTSPGDAVASPNPAVAKAQALLERLPELDPAEHPDLYQEIHAELQGALSAIDDA